MRFNTFLAITVFSCLCASAQSWQEKVVAAVLMGEARGEGRIGLVAVGEVVAERVKERGQTPFQVVTARLEFSSKNGVSAAAMVHRYSRVRGYSTALEVAHIVCVRPDRLPGITKFANHFDRKGGHPWWAGSGVLVASVGQHNFYRVP